MERREYQRVKVSSDALLFLDDTTLSSREFSGTIDDISENGIKIVANKQAMLSVMSVIGQIGAFHFQSIDEFSLFGKQKEVLVMGQAQIVRREETDDSYIFGCKLMQNTADLLNYVSDRKMAALINS